VLIPISKPRRERARPLWPRRKGGLMALETGSHVRAKHQAAERLLGFVAALAPFTVIVAAPQSPP
jgi:hypothetical protein